MLRIRRITYAPSQSQSLLHLPIKLNNLFLIFPMNIPMFFISFTVLLCILKYSLVLPVFKLYIRRSYGMFSLLRKLTILWDLSEGMCSSASFIFIISVPLYDYTTVYLLILLLDFCLCPWYFIMNSVALGV